MDTSTWVMVALAVATLIVVYIKSPEAAHKGINATGSLILEITPRMIAAFLLAGLIQAIVPQEVIVRWMGHGTGLQRHFDRYEFGRRYAWRSDDPFPGHRDVL